MQSSVIDQLTVARYLETQDLDAHVATVSAVYRERRDAMAAAIGRVLPDSAHVTHPDGGMFLRSEEHTSELQSRGHLVCRLLLEKKKTRSDQTGLQVEDGPQQQRRRLRAGKR